MRAPITVKQLGNYLKREIQTDPFLRDVLVIGEIVSLSKRNYTYFSLIEDNESISCVFFNNNFNFSEGDKVIVSGSVNLFTRDSKYQIRVNSVDLVGQGQKLLDLMKIKERLYKEGYFDIESKKPIPRFPKKIGLITGYKSAAYSDFIKVFYDSNYDVDIYFYPSLVQGTSAELDIIKALNVLDNMNLDLLVLTRGGGSTEDLSVFNGEKLARAIFNAKTPIISAIGHEIDTSIAELVSDLRLQTPTKAGEIIVKEYVSSLEQISNIKLNQERFINSYLSNVVSTLIINRNKIQAHSPKIILEKYSLQLENYKALIASKLNDNISSLERTLSSLSKDIDEKHKKIIDKNYVYIKSLKDKYVELKKLKVGDSYYLFNKNSKFRIKIEEQINEWKIWRFIRKL